MVYNKLFTKILDSTIWLENDTTRLVWVTMLAAMDEDGFVALSSPGNVAARARVDLAAAETALETLASPDSHATMQEHDGRRIEQVPGGFMVLNARIYNELANRKMLREQTRLRVSKHRKRNTSVTLCNDDVTNDALHDVTSNKKSRSYSDTDALHTQQQPSILPSANRGSIHVPKKPKIGRARKTVFSDDARNLALQLKTHILENNPDARIKDAQVITWTREADLMLRVDHRDPRESAAIMDWCQHDLVDEGRWQGWGRNILSMGSFRDHWAQLKVKANGQQRPTQPPHSTDGLCQTCGYNATLHALKKGSNPVARYPVLEKVCENWAPPPLDAPR